MTQSQTTVVSLQQLAELADLEPKFFYRHRDELPKSTPVLNGSRGRPQLHFEVSDIVEFIMERTGFMSEVELRIRAALAPEKSRRPRGEPRLIDEAGVCHVIPSDLRDISPDERELFRRTRDADTARVHADRAKKRIATRPINDTEG